MKAVKIFHENFTRKTIAIKVITTFLAFIQTLNNFTFNSKHLLQTKGCAMGTICAPSYANTFEVHFERKYIYPLIEGKSLTYFRHIDDIFLIWTGTKNKLDQFFKYLNKKHPSIKFDYKASNNQIVFLTLKYIYTTVNYAQLYRKETDQQH